MTGLVPVIQTHRPSRKERGGCHVAGPETPACMDGRDKPGQDDHESQANISSIQGGTRLGLPVACSISTQVVTT